MATKILLLALLAAGVSTELIGFHPAFRNAVFTAALLVGLIASRRARGRIEDLPLPRSRFVELGAPFLLAILAAAPTLSLPYFADDYFHLRRIGDEPSFLAALRPPPTVVTCRPVAWVFWWVVGKVFPFDATGARVLCILLFATSAALLVLAQRRIGVPRGLAVAAACLFATSPAAIEAVAWVFNIYSLLSGAFALLCIAGWPSASFVATFATASLAYLSKEDTFLLPVGLFLAAGGGRRGARRALPALAALAFALTLRVLVFGQALGYQDAFTGESHLVRTSAAIGSALALDFPSNVFVALRSATPGERGWLGLVSTGLPLAILALGSATAAARVGLARGLLFALLGLLPVASLLPIGTGLEGIRFLYISSMGCSLALASLAVGASRRGGFVVLAILLSFAVESRNLDAWRESAEVQRRIASGAAPYLKPLRVGARVLALSPPSSWKGVPCLGAGNSDALARFLRRDDIRVFNATDGFGTFDLALEIDPSTGSVRRERFDAPARVLAPGESIVFDLRSGSPDRAACRACNADPFEAAGGAIGLHGIGTESVLLLPSIGVTPGSELTFSLDADVTDSLGRPQPLPLTGSFARGDVVERVVLPERAVVPDGVRVLRLELVPLRYERIAVRSVRITASPR